MKTYTIKPLEWKDFPKLNRIQCAPYTIFTYGDDPRAKLAVSLLFEQPHECATIEAAKTKAQELHEQELAKYLQEVE